LYHLQYKPWYRLLGEPDYRHRRPMSVGRAVERLMVLVGARVVLAVIPVHQTEGSHEVRRPMPDEEPTTITFGFTLTLLLAPLTESSQENRLSWLARRAWRGHRRADGQEPRSRTPWRR
jgi:hypothetical protein